MKDEARDRSFERMLGSAVRRSLQNGFEACPDAETLAAWSDNGLQPALRRQVDSHLASCGRCQAQLAALARSEGRIGRSPVLPRRWLSWRWLVPTAAAATALAVWVAVQPDVLRSPQEVPAPPSAAKIESPAATATAPAVREKTTPSQRRDAAVPPRPVAPLAAERPASGDRPQITREMAATASPERGVAERRENAKREAKTRAKHAAIPEQVAVPAAPPAAKSALAMADTGAALVIASNDPSVRWRIRGADLERTVDGGATWARQPTGTNVPLTAGVSPSPDVCWIVGREGTVLRSIDGRVWHKIPFPEPADLVQVESSGPAHATVTTADARRFTTIDGGATWKPEGLQEF